MKSLYLIPLLFVGCGSYQSQSDAAGVESIILREPSCAFSMTKAQAKIAVDKYIMNCKLTLPGQEEQQCYIQSAKGKALSQWIWKNGVAVELMLKTNKIHVTSYDIKCADIVDDCGDPEVAAACEVL